ncbi:beta expansin8 [Zea mays]|uniref:Beta expansin8 n=1 Tax=Zea mays TaxID=4577 RepID=A0A1D6P6W7_MAIZE|nr:beta expansin8 [Zea mays]
MESKTARGPPTGRWTPMRESWGSVWRMDTNHRMQPPFSIRIRNESGKTLVANNVIPANWRPNTFYRSFVQYSWSWLAGALLGSVTIVYSTILCSTTTRLLLLLLVYYHQVRRNGTASRRRRPWEGRCLRSPCRCSCIVIMVLGVVASLIASRQARRQKN